MKALIVAALLSASTFAVHADIVVVPTPKDCEQARVENDKVVIAPCAKMEKERAAPLKKARNRACQPNGTCPGLITHNYNIAHGTGRAESQKAVNVYGGVGGNATLEHNAWDTTYQARDVTSPKAE